MAITLKDLRDGLTVFDSVAEQRKTLEENDMSMTRILLSNKKSEDYLSFAAALDAMRRYAGGALVPGSYLDRAFRPLLNKMEELDTLVAGDRAGLAEGAANPFIFSELNRELGNFASYVGVCLEESSEIFTLGPEEVDLLRSLDGMVRHFELQKNKDWEVLRGAVPAMSEPAPMDDGLVDSLQLNWFRKKQIARAESDARAALAAREDGRGRILLDSRRAALEDEKKLAQDRNARPDPESRPYLLMLTLTAEIVKYKAKYEETMPPESQEAMQSVYRNLMILDDMMAGPDSTPDAPAPDPKEVQQFLTENVWPEMVQYFGRFKPTTKVVEEDSRIFRIMYELQNTLALPEKVNGADMRPVYNYTEDPEKPETPWPGALKTAHEVWEKSLDRRDEARRAEKERLENLEKQRQAELAEKRRQEEKVEREKHDAMVRELERLKKLREEAEAKRKLQEEEEKARKEEEEKERRKAEDARREAENRIVIPKSEYDQAEEEFKDLAKETAERVDPIMKANPTPTLEQMNPTMKEPPKPAGKTWETFASELHQYLKDKVGYKSPLVSPGTEANYKTIPHYRELCQLLVAEGRFGDPKLKKEEIDERELYQEVSALQEDPGFKKCLQDVKFRYLVSGRQVKKVWEEIKTASDQEYKKKNKGSPYRFTVAEKRTQLQNLLEANQSPIKNAVSSVYARLTDPRYNGDIQKTGFLFFKPSDTGFYQTAVDSLEKIAHAPGYPLSEAHLREAKVAVKEYLDRRMEVRSHEYGQRRWERMMCAYRALATKTEFETYCAQVNAKRGVTDPTDRNYVHPSAFGADRVDLRNPKVPMNEMLARLGEQYAADKAAGKEDAEKQYFSRVAAMRTQAARNPNDPEKKGDWGMLVDVTLLEEQAETLREDTRFLSHFKPNLKEFSTEERQAMLVDAEKSLYPRQWGPGIESDSLDNELIEEEQDLNESQYEVIRI